VSERDIVIDNLSRRTRRKLRQRVTRAITEPLLQLRPTVARNVVASNNITGLFAGPNAILRVAHSVVTGNNTGANTSGGGVINSYVDNDINYTTVENYSTLTPLPMH
jgi:hypothetical protein